MNPTRLLVIPVWLLCTLLFDPAAWAGQAPELPVPAYPGWTLRQVDQRTDTEGGTEGVLFQYVSNDPADKIVKFYEKATSHEAVLSKISAMYTVYGSDGTLISVIGPDGGVPELDQAGEHVVRVWKSMITIVRFQAVAR
jgi:hypothetical protein